MDLPNPTLTPDTAHPIGLWQELFYLKELPQKETVVEQLPVVNGNLDFSTPPSALEEAKPYWHNAQYIRLADFSHVDDVEKLQPAAGQLIEGDKWNGMCTHRIKVHSAADITPEVIDWMRKAYEEAG